ncbi:MAG TPA: serine/threonine protein kinase [Planctomycetes bacterium]|nr:serine/threonine protein kinase [Fuerstiella sp.]HIK91511.1 serine/threonine protein kinase [Planctomycetota bacterium]
MKPNSSLLSRILHSASELINYRASLARIRFQEGESHVRESSEQGLLRRRLRASAMVLLMAKVAITIRTMALSGSPDWLDCLIFLGLLLASAWLYSPRNVSALWLRTIETLMFLGVSLQLGLHLHEDLRHYATVQTTTAEENTGAAVAFVTAVKDQIIATFGLMMIYGMFIPNTPRRAALMVFLMAITPAVVIGLHESSIAAIETFRIEHIASAGLFSGNLLALAVGAGCAIYGTAIMNRWRSRALEAEQLGQYRLGEKIGSGGMGDVYLAEHRLLKRLCAVKLIRSELSEDPVILKRFQREVQTTATLTHWNTVQVFDYGQMTDGTFFYVMEHLHGKNLKQAVTEFGPMPEDRVIFILRQICNALREAAARKLVHRDIKPSNVFLAHVGERFDVVKLLDFGLVRPLTSTADAELSVVNDIKGSPRYMCPEQAQGISPDTRGDLYSLGAVAYFLLTGRPPFDLENTLKLVIAHATQVPPTFSEIGADISPELSAVVMRCLSKLPEDRFQSPDEMLDALEVLPLAENWNWRLAEAWWKEHFFDCLRKPEACTDETETTTDNHNDEALEETIVSVQR